MCNSDKDGSTVIHGKIEITDNSLIYRLKGRSPIIWPLRCVPFSLALTYFYYNSILFPLGFCAHTDMIKISLASNVGDVVLQVQVINYTWVISVCHRCLNDLGVYVFKCSNAEQLFKTLLEVINNATNINSSNIAINVSDD